MAKNDRHIYQIPETRRKVLDTAWRLFLTRGFFDTQMKDVADAAGLSRTSLYRYFRDKTDLASALVGEVFEALFADDAWRASLPPGATGADELRHLFLNHWLSPRFHDQMVFLAEFDAYFSRGRVPADFRQTLSDRLPFRDEAIWRPIFERGARDGSLRADLNPHLTWVTVFNAVRGLQERVLLRGDLLIETQPGETERMTSVLVDLLLAGLKPPKE